MSAPRITLRFRDADAFAGGVVRAALERSFSRAQLGPEGRVVVLVNPGAEDLETARAAIHGGGKLVLLGRLAPPIAELAGLDPIPEPVVSAEEATATPDRDRPWDESPAHVLWDDRHALGRAAPLARRAFCRFDYEDEWNNLGFGRIFVDGSPFALAAAARAEVAEPLAWVAVGTETRGAFAAVREWETGSLLWIGRSVGPVDGLDWAVVERFVADHRPDDLPCLPCWSDLPAGFGSAAVARLDCDEAVASARPLLELYRDRGFPLSLAVRADLPLDAADRAVLAEAIAAGGAVLSHSYAHPPDWGASEDEAFAEARRSRERLEQAVPAARPVRFAVSPFHRNPPHALRGLGAAGYHGLVTGIIDRDPECLIGRAGVLPFAEPPLVSHSQQSMLHGECFRRQGGRIQVWQQVFEAHRAADAVYGYLDHPFSPRYQYDWRDEAERIGAHERLLDVFDRSDGLWRPGLGELLDRLVRRARAALALGDDGLPAVAAPERDVPFAVRFRGKIHAARSASSILASRGVGAS